MSNFSQFQLQPINLKFGVACVTAYNKWDDKVDLLADLLHIAGSKSSRQADLWAVCKN